MIGELRARYMPRFLSVARERVARSLAMLGDPDGFDLIGAELHSLAGEAGVLGIVDLAQEAREGERACRLASAGEAREAAVCARALRALSKQIAALAAQEVSVEKVDDVRVLVVDDSALIAGQLVDALADAGMSCRAAHDVAGAVAAARAEPPHVVLLDANMPDIDVFGLFSAMRSACPSSTRFLLVSGIEPGELEALARQLGAAGCIGKRDGLAAIVAYVKQYASGDGTP